MDAVVLEHSGRWLAVVQDCGDPEIGTGYALSEALRAALKGFSPVADELLASVEK